MSQVRAQDRLNRRLTERRTRAALKTVARIQDLQHAEDMETEPPVRRAPSLRRHETLVLPAPTDSDPSDNEMDQSDGEQGDPEKDEGPSSEDEDSDDMEEEDRQGRRKKKKGDGVRALIASMRKPHLAGVKKPAAILVTKVPTPAPKGKARALASCVFTSHPKHPLHADN
jgi:hypothetical protein